MSHISNGKGLHLNQPINQDGINEIFLRVQVNIF